MSTTPDLTTVESGKFKLILIQSFSLDEVLDDGSRGRLYDWRSGRPETSPQPLKRDFRLGSFNYRCNEQDSLRMRMHRSVKDFTKVIPTRLFVDRATPQLFEEPPGQPMSDAENLASSGQAIHLSRLLGSSASSTVLYDSSQLRVFPDATLSFRMQFSSADLRLDHLVDVITTLSECTRRCVVEKLSAVLMDFVSHYPALADLHLSLSHSTDPVILQATTASFVTSHKLLILESLRDPDGRIFCPTDEMIGPHLIALLRQTHKSAVYREKVVTSVLSETLGYKRDELYITLRGTSVFLVPQHWTPQSFLSLYIDDLALFIEYYVSRLSVLESLTLLLSDIQLPSQLYSRLPAAHSAVTEIIRYRKIFLSVEEALDLDLYVNHYFTREVLSQLFSQRGIANKMRSVRTRLEGIDRTLELVLGSSLSNMGVWSSGKQVTVAIWAVAATLICTLISLAVSILRH